MLEHEKSLSLYSIKTEEYQPHNTRYCFCAADKCTQCVELLSVNTVTSQNPHYSLVVLDLDLD